MTLLCRDVEDVVDAHLAFHLNAGVDFVIATDHRSVDGTTEILERYAREGHLHLIREQSEEFLQPEWVTRMARMASTDLGADWVINSDSDEFWWPRGSDLKDVLSAVPDRYGLIRAHWRTFPPRPDDGGFFAERMTVRLAPVAPINDPTTPWRPNAKVIHRADPDVSVRAGNHTVRGSALQVLRGWSPVEVLHFPWRSSEHSARKSASFSEGMYHGLRLAHEANAKGELADRYESFVVDDDVRARGLASGALVEDTRLRDALRTLAGTEEVAADASGRHFTLPPDPSPLAFPRPSVVDDVAYAVDAAVYAEAELVRAQRHLDDLEQRVAALEKGVGPRALGALRRVARRGVVT